MPNRSSGHTHAGSATWSDTASQASAADPTTSNRQNQIQLTKSGGPYAPGYNGGPPNDGLFPGIYIDPNTGRQYILPEPPLADGSTGPPQTSPIFPIYEYSGPTSPLGPATYLYSESNSQMIYRLGPASGSGSGSGFQHGSGSPSNQTAETRMTLARPRNQTAETRMTLLHGGRLYTPLVYQHSGDNNNIDQIASPRPPSPSPTPTNWSPL